MEAVDPKERAMRRVRACGGLDDLPDDALRTTFAYQHALLREEFVDLGRSLRDAARTWWPLFLAAWLIVFVVFAWHGF